MLNIRGLVVLGFVALAWGGVVWLKHRPPIEISLNGRLAWTVEAPDNPTRAELIWHGLIK
ncbi:MAG: hypothetical protein AAB964_02675 [Patescibacteria group bacterium]